MEVIHWCLDLGIPEISVYAFSIANFQRTRQEVDGLMNLSEVKYREMMEVILGSWSIKRCQNLLSYPSSIISVLMYAMDMC